MEQPRENSSKENYGDGSYFTHYLGNDELIDHDQKKEKEENILDGKVAEGNESIEELNFDSEEKRHSGL